MERRGQLHLLCHRGTLKWTSESPAAFRVRYDISQEEWAASEAAWPASERALRYGLVGTQRQRGLSVDYGLAGERSREANARRSREANARQAAKKS